MYNRTTCMQVATNAIYMSKEDALNSILVFYTNKYAGVMSCTKMSGKVPLILLIKESTTPYEDWLHIMGKMLKKDNRSKYFKQPSHLHMVNGSFNPNDRDSLHVLQAECVMLLNKYKESIS